MKGDGNTATPKVTPEIAKLHCQVERPPTYLPLLEMPCLPVRTRLCLLSIFLFITTDSYELLQEVSHLGSLAFARWS